ncbi:MAG: hypothetical protein ABW318_06575 [Vicinamibacterales bacterium]
MPMDSAFQASAVSRRDASRADGILVLWTAPPQIGYSVDRFESSAASQLRKINEIN